MSHYKTVRPFIHSYSLLPFNPITDDICNNMRLNHKSDYEYVSYSIKTLYSKNLARKKKLNGINLKLKDEKKKISLITTPSLENRS